MFPCDSHMTDQHFPQGFYWGTATAAFQIEGATHEDGRGESIWDRFCATPGKILTGETGDPATDSYHRFLDDIALMKAMNLNAYRFSIAWPRIIPDGDGRVCEQGLDYYDRVVDGLLEANICPFITLYHWDLPQALQEKGGWAKRTTLNAYARYSKVVVKRLGDRVKNWMTHNEPWCVSILSNEIGEHAPGNHDRRLALQVAHNLLVSHGMGVSVIRQGCPDGKVGIVLNFNPFYPATDSQADQALARQEHARFNLWFLDPLAGRGYPQDAWEGYGTDVPHLQPGDMQTIAAPIDFLGINFYTRSVVHDPQGIAGSRILNIRSETNQTGRNWEIYPQAMYDLLVSLHLAYNFKNIYLTENGASYHDLISPDGKIHDALRIDFLQKHFSVLLRAMEAGVPLRGYFCWSLLDNFEWAFGTSSRFGLAYTDFDTQKRTLKDSGVWYGKVARANALLD
jgi:beta-glucosidase